MDCDPKEVACQLERIANQLPSHESSAFWETFSATVAGAFIASFISLLLYWHAERNRSRSRADDASIELVRAIAAFTAELKQWKQSMDSTGSDTALNPEPVDTPVLIASEVLLLTSGKKDRAVAKKVRDVTDGLALAKPQRRWTFGLLASVVTAWRAGRRTADETMTALHKLDDLWQSLVAKTHSGIPPTLESLYGHKGSESS